MFEEAIKDAHEEANENILHQERRVLRDRATLRAPNKYCDFIDIDEIFIAESH